MGGYNYWIRPSDDLALAEAEGEVIPATRLLDPAFIRSLLAGWGVTLGADNLKIEASLWTKYYVTTVYPLVLGAMSLAGVGIDASLANTKLVMSRTAGTKKMDGLGYPIRVIFEDVSGAVVYRPRCEVPELAQAARPVGSLPELHRAVFQSLFEEHITPLFDRWQAVTGVSKKILWGNLGVGIYSFYSFLAETLDCPAAHTEDGPALLDTVENELIAPGRNPLYQPILLRPSLDPNDSNLMQLRTTCCLWYKVPQAEKCHSCPLIKPGEIAGRWKNRAAS